MEIIESGREMEVADWLALWGCDPQYDKAPREFGDGYIFYNYGVLFADKDYLRNQLIPAIRRQLLADLSPEDRDNFQQILEFVEEESR